mmetsp:Transcript_3319/g.5167  ORF Transcript_3319/g.5167 Transcript_3319/m.5167 type:complete len:282 (+) Transcript_3319:57-902(+)
MFLKIFVILGVIGLLVQAKKVKFRGNDKTHTVDVPHPEFLPRDWSGFRVEKEYPAKIGSSTGGFLIASEYLLSTVCKGPESLNYAMGMDVCMVGMNENGEVVGSAILELKSSDAEFIEFTKTEYKSNNCMGVPKVSNEKVPVTCYTPGPPSTVGVRYAYTTDPAPWTSYDNGLVFKFYDTQDACGGDKYDAFTWYSQDACLPSTLDDGTEGSLKFPSCNDASFSVEQYKDPFCTEFYSSMTGLLPVCEGTDGSSDDGDMITSNFQTLTCSNTTTSARTPSA